MNNQLQAFNALRTRKNFQSTEPQHSAPILIQLTAHEDRDVLLVVNKSGKAVAVDYRAYTGRLRPLLRAIQEATEEADHAFTWDDSGQLTSGIELQAFPSLIPMLADCTCLVDAELRPIQMASTPHTLSLRISKSEKDGSLQSRYALCEGEHHTPTTLEAAPRFLDERHLLCGDTIYQHQHSGGTAQTAKLFVETLPSTQLEAFLSLFASAFPHIPIELEGHETRDGSPIQAQPTLAFREVDDDDTLYIELLDSVAQLPQSFINDYDITTAAICKPGQLILREIDYRSTHEARNGLLQQLKKLAKATKGSHSYFDIDDDGTLLLGSDLANAFLSSDLAQIANQFQLIGAEKLKRYKISYSKPKLNLSLSSGIDFLEGTGTIELEGETFSLLEALRQYQKNNYIQLSSGDRAVLDSDYIARLQRLFKKNKKGLQVSFFDLPAIEALLDESASTAQLPESREVFAGFNTLKTKKVPTPRFKGKLRPYQREGLQWLDYLHTHKLGGCLADDMGLGKTIQAIALLTRIYPKVKTPSLLVMPRSLVFNWSREFERFAPDLKIATHYGTGRDWKKSLKAQIILTTYGTLRADIETIVPTKFHAVILDESQAIKNSQAQTTQAALALKAQFRLALSGTPIENNLGELFALFRFLNPAMFRNQSEFDRDYGTPIQKKDDQAAADELRRKIFPFILRRLKGDVLKDLPPKVEQTLYVEMGAEQKAHYENRRNFYQQVIRKEIDTHGLGKSQFAILEALLELRQIASVPESKTDGRIESAKSERLLEALEEATSNGHKCLVFTNFLAGVEQISTALQTRGISHLSMTGATSNRQELVERFQNDTSIKAFIMTLKTGGVGLNLTAADTVFIFDPWWNTSAESQAVDRAHRMGQKNTVFTYRLIAKDSIEEKIQQLQQQKKQLVDQIVTTDGESFKQLSESDINTLFNA